MEDREYKVTRVPKQNKNELKNPTKEPKGKEILDISMIRNQPRKTHFWSVITNNKNQ